MQLKDKYFAVRNATAQLEKCGAMVLGSTTDKPRPVIEIAFPTIEMQEKAIEMTERVKGGLRTVYLSPERIYGCIVRWRIYEEQENVEQLVQNMSDYAPELLAFGPRNL